VPFILASRSSRRAELLTRAGYTFSVVPADIDERIRDGEAPEPYVRRLALEKAARVAGTHPELVVLGADTVVVIEGRVLGKPADDEETVAVLRRLSGRTHEVLTGVALLASHEEQSDIASTRVTFRELTAGDIAWYVGTGEPRGKAGAYAIQGIASRFVTRIDGSYTNVVGLPIALVDRLLRAIQGRGLAHPLDLVAPGQAGETGGWRLGPGAGHVETTSARRSVPAATSTGNDGPGRGRR